MKDDKTKLTINTYDLIYNDYIKDFENEETGNDFINIFLSYFESEHNLILDAGCGPGNMSFTLVNNNQNVIGIDLSKNMIQYARSYVKNAKFYIRDVRSTKFEDCVYDGIVASRILFHVPKDDLLATFKEFSRILKKEGILGILVSIEDDSREVIEKEAYDPSLDIYYHYPSYDELSNYLDVSNFEILSNAINTSVDIDSGLAKKWLTIIARKKS